MTDEIALIGARSYCVFMLLIALIFRKFPPKEINILYGYRTKRSMANQQVWNTANSYWIQLFLKLTLLAFIFPLLSYFVFSTVDVLLFTIICSVLLLLITIPLTERHLNKHFDKKAIPSDLLKGFQIRIFASNL